MLLMEKGSGDLVRVDDVESLFNPFTAKVMGRDQAGEEEQDWTSFGKRQLTFPSGEALPLCWTDPDYRRHTSSSAKQSGHA